jgi:hypothetical protein
MARALGASLYALVLGPPRTAAAVDVLAAAAAAYGADKLLVGEVAAAIPLALDAAWGAALVRLFERIPPAVVLFPAGKVGLELGPALAARLGATYAPRCEVKVEGFGRPADSGVRLERLRPDERSLRSLDPVGWERPIVATLGAGEPPAPRPAIEIGVEILPEPMVDLAPAPAIVGPDAWAAWPEARLIVLVGTAGGPRRQGEDEGARTLATHIAKALGPQLERRGAVVAAASEVPAAVLEATSAQIVLKLGWSPARLPALPDTRLAVVLEADAPEPPPPDDRCDILLRLEPGETLDGSLSQRLLAQLLSEDAVIARGAVR